MHPWRIKPTSVEFMQVKFEFGHGPMIFDRVITFEEIFSFLYLLFGCVYKVEIACVEMP
jgi:hypothetical protein